MDNTHQTRDVQKQNHGSNENEAASSHSGRTAVSTGQTQINARVVTAEEPGEKQSNTALSESAEERGEERGNANQNAIVAPSGKTIPGHVMRTGNHGAETETRSRTTTTETDVVAETDAITSQPVVPARTAAETLSRGPKKREQTPPDVIIIPEDEPPTPPPVQPENLKVSVKVNTPDGRTGPPPLNFTSSPDHDVTRTSSPKVTSRPRVMSPAAVGQQQMWPVFMMSPPRLLNMESLQISTVTSQSAQPMRKVIVVHALSPQHPRKQQNTMVTSPVLTPSRVNQQPSMTSPTPVTSQSNAVPPNCGTSASASVPVTSSAASNKKRSQNAETTVQAAESLTPDVRSTQKPDSTSQNEVQTPGPPGVQSGSQTRNAPTNEERSISQVPGSGLSNETASATTSVSSNGVQPPALIGRDGSASTNGRESMTGVQPSGLADSLSQNRMKGDSPLERQSFCSSQLTAPPGHQSPKGSHPPLQSGRHSLTGSDSPMQTERRQDGQGSQSPTPATLTERHSPTGTNSPASIAQLPSGRHFPVRTRPKSPIRSPGLFDSDSPTERQSSDGAYSPRRQISEGQCPTEGESASAAILSADSLTRRQSSADTHSATPNGRTSPGNQSRIDAHCPAPTDGSPRTKFPTTGHQSETIPDADSLNGRQSRVDAHSQNTGRQSPGRHSPSGSPTPTDGYQDSDTSSTTTSASDCEPEAKDEFNKKRRQNIQANQEFLRQLGIAQVSGNEGVSIHTIPPWTPLSLQFLFIHINLQILWCADQ